MKYTSEDSKKPRASAMFRGLGDYSTTRNRAPRAANTAANPTSTAAGSRTASTPCPKEIREWKPSMAQGVGRTCEARQSQRGITSLGHQQPPSAARIMLRIQPTAEAFSGVERTDP